MAKIDQNTTGLQNILDLVNNLPTDGGVELPILDNPGAANDLAEGKQLIDENGNVITGNITTVNADTISILNPLYTDSSISGDNFKLSTSLSYDILYRAGSDINLRIPKARLGNATTDDVVVDKTFTSSNGLVLTGDNPYKKTETNNEVNTQKNLISQIQTALANKTTGNGGSSLDTSDANVTEAVLFKNYVAYGANDKRVVGSFTLDSEINSQNSLLTQIQSALQNKSSASGTKETWTFTMEDNSTVTKEVYV